MKLINNSLIYNQYFRSNNEHKMFSRNNKGCYTIFGLRIQSDHTFKELAKLEINESFNQYTRIK